MITKSENKQTFNIYMSSKFRTAFNTKLVSLGINNNQFFTACVAAFMVGDITTNSIPYGERRVLRGVTTKFDDTNVVKLYTRSGELINPSKLSGVVEGVDEF